jgi:hypothetical protein
MKVTKVGLLTKQNVIDIVGPMSGMLAAILTNLQSHASTLVTLPITLGKGIKARKIELAVSFPNILSTKLTHPVSVDEAQCFHLMDSGKYGALMMFQNQFFAVTTHYVDASAVEEAVLQIKKLVYSQDNKLKRLQQEVETMERVISQKGVQRTPISEGVKLLVWTRDEGKCMRCGSSENLHFDHIIPVVKGGGNSESNIQILCERCNLQKADRITF